MMAGIKILPPELIYEILKKIQTLYNLRKVIFLNKRLFNVFSRNKKNLLCMKINCYKLSFPGNYNDENIINFRLLDKQIKLGTFKNNNWTEIEKLIVNILENSWVINVEWGDLSSVRSGIRVFSNSNGSTIQKMFSIAKWTGNSDYKKYKKYLDNSNLLTNLILSLVGKFCEQEGINYKIIYR